MGIVIDLFPRAHAHASTDTAGRGTSGGQGASGQFLENQRSVRSSRRTWMSAPSSMAPSFLESPSARQLTADSSRPVIDAYARATVSKCSMPSMPPISVELPRKSTAILQRDRLASSGYFTGMWGAKEIQAWVDRRKEAMDIRSDAEVERRSGKKFIIQNLRKGNKPKIDGLTALAKALDDWPSEIFGPTTTESAVELLRAEQLEHQKAIEGIELAIKILERKTG